MHTRIRAHPEDRVTEVREGEERNRDTSRSSRQTHPKRAGLSGFSCSALRTHDDHTFALRVSCAPGRSGERGSSRLVLTQEDSATWRVHTARRWVECFRAESSCKCSFGRLNPPFETRSFPRVSSRARCASCTVWRNECHSSSGNFDEMHYDVMNSRCEYRYTRGCLTSLGLPFGEYLENYLHHNYNYVSPYFEFAIYSTIYSMT